MFQTCERAAPPCGNSCYGCAFRDLKKAEPVYGRMPKKTVQTCKIRKLGKNYNSKSGSGCVSGRDGPAEIMGDGGHIKGWMGDA